MTVHIVTTSTRTHLRIAVGRPSLAALDQALAACGHHVDVLPTLDGALAPRTGLVGTATSTAAITCRACRRTRAFHRAAAAPEVTDTTGDIGDRVVVTHGRHAGLAGVVTRYADGDARTVRLHGGTVLVTPLADLTRGSDNPDDFDRPTLAADGLTWYQLSR